MSARRRFIPMAARCAATRLGASCGQRPRRAERSKASWQPIATASPCSRRSEKPVAASSAWAKVWPRLRSARSPSSVSSRATIAAFISQERRTAWSRAAGVAVAQAGAVRLQPAEEGGVAEEAVLRHLAVAGEEVARGQGVEEHGVGEDEARLVEGADQVLALARVDPGLAADRAVDLGEERRRDLDEADAAAHHRRGEAGEVADHPAAEGDDEVVAADLLGDQPFHGALELGPALGRLAGRQLEDRGLDAGRGQPGAQRGQVQRRHPRLGQDRHTRGGGGRGRSRPPPGRGGPGRCGCRRRGRRAGTVTVSLMAQAPGSGSVRAAPGRRRAPRRRSRAPSPRGWRRGGCRR